jgi:hypothetical protein
MRTFRQCVEEAFRRLGDDPRTTKLRSAYADSMLANDPRRHLIDDPSIIRDDEGLIRDLVATFSDPTLAAQLEALARKHSPDERN